MSDIKLTLPYPPSANRYWRNYRGRMVKSTEARNYAGAVERVALDTYPTEDRMFMGKTKVSVTLKLFRPRKAGDLDNRIKICLDALQNVGYKNDDQVVEIHAYRFDDKSNPRVEVEIVAFDREMEVLRGGK